MAAVMMKSAGETAPSTLVMGNSGNAKTHGRKLNILLLCCEHARHIGTVEDHIRAFDRFSHHNVFALDSAISSHLDLDLDLFDAIVFHYSIVIASQSYLPPAFAQRLGRFNGPKILYIQDEFRWVDRTCEAIRNLGIGTIFTVANKEAIRRIYRDPWFDNIRFEQTLTGFVPEDLLAREVPDYASRAIDVSYRARKLPFWCGSFALQKWQIGERFLRDAPRYGLKCDIAMSEASRLYGDAWIEFIANSKAMLGTESGASFIDYSGTVHERIDRYREAHPGASFEHVRDLFLEGRDGAVTINVISPRCFEAAALRTLMILYPGDYSGILKPGRHFVLLKPDHSNIEDVVRILRDPERAGEIIHNAYRDIACSDRLSFAAMARHFDAVVSQVVASAAAPGTAAGRRPADRKDFVSSQEQVALHMAALMKTYRRRQRLAKIRYQMVPRLQRADMAVRNLVASLPRPVASPILMVGRVATRFGKPALRRLLLR